MKCKHGEILYGKKCISCEKDRLIESKGNEVCSSIRWEAKIRLDGYCRGVVDVISNPPVAFVCELAREIDRETGEYKNWERRLSFDPPNVPKGSMRRLRPLYAVEIT